MPTIEEKLQQARALIDSALIELADQPPGEQEVSCDQEPPTDMIAAFDAVTVSGLAEVIQPFAFDANDCDLIVYAKCQLSGISGEAGVISLENDGNTRHLQVGVGYNFGSMSAETGRISLRARAGYEYTHSGIGGQEMVAAPAEFALHFDSDRGCMNLWVRGETNPWKWAGSCPAPKFAITRIRYYTRTNGPASQNVQFSEVEAYRPWAVSIGDSITAGHNEFDPVPGYYSGTDNGICQWQAHCWPDPNRRNSIIVNKGIGGQTTTQVNARIREAHKHGNGLVLLSVQNNDAGKAVSLEQRTANIQSSIDQCAAAGCAVHLIGAIYPNNQSSAPWYKQWRDQYLPQLTGHAGYIEIMDAVADPSTGNISTAYASDGVHPNVAGYTLIGQHIAASL